MKPIALQFTAEEAHNNLVLLDLAIKHPTEGGAKTAMAAIPIMDKIKKATIEYQKSESSDVK